MWEFELLVYFQPLLQLLHSRAVDRTEPSSEEPPSDFPTRLLIFPVECRRIETGTPCSPQFTVRGRAVLPPAGVFILLLLQQAAEVTGYFCSFRTNQWLDFKSDSDSCSVPWTTFLYFFYILFLFLLFAVGDGVSSLHLSKKDEKIQTKAHGRPLWFWAGLRLHWFQTTVWPGKIQKDNPGPAGTFAPVVLHLPVRAVTISCRLSQTPNSDDVMESALARPNIATVFHQVLTEQNQTFDHQGHKPSPRSFFLHSCKIKLIVFATLCFQRTFLLPGTGPSRPGPSPASVAHRGAAVGLGVLVTAETASSWALTTRRGTTSAPSPTPSTSPMWEPSARRPRRVWTQSTLLPRWLPLIPVRPQWMQIRHQPSGFHYLTATITKVIHQTSTAITF